MSGTLEQDAPLTAEDFAALLQPFLPLPSRCAVAVSGGPDSMALAYCLKRYHLTDLIAFTVDHGLRQSSATEATEATQVLKGLGISAEILSWHHDSIGSRLHEKARQARYRLLEEACARHGREGLFVAHQREDQAETILMRIAKGSGVEGLGGMAPVSHRQSINILRPFLTVPKNRLIATCQSANIPFVEDPSNASDKFARGRIRNVMPLLEKEGFTIKGLLMLSDRARQASEAVTFYARDFASRFVTNGQGGTVSFARQFFEKLPRAIGLKVLADCLSYINDDDHPPEYNGLTALMPSLLSGFPSSTRSFYGCLISTTDTRISLMREPSAARDVIEIDAGQSVFWDRRWYVSASGSEVGGTRLMVKALGTPPHDLIDKLAPRLRHQIPQGRVRASLPGIWEGDRLEAIPSFDEGGLFQMVFRKQAFPKV